MRVADINAAPTTNNDEAKAAKYKKLRRTVLFGVGLALLIVAWHVYENLTANQHKTKTALQNIIQMLFTEEVVRASYSVHLHLQCKTSNAEADDCAHKPLLETNSEELFSQSNSTIVHLQHLFKYYASNVSLTAEIELLQLKFLKAVLNTSVMIHTMEFLMQNNFAVDSHKKQLQLLLDIWFQPYYAGKENFYTTGFEHVFMLHNWIYFYEEENFKNVNYLGYMDHVALGKHQHYISIRMSSIHKKKQYINSFFVGTSPEFEVSINTLCFLLYERKPCPIFLGKIPFIVTTYAFNSHGKTTLATAYVFMDK